MLGQAILEKSKNLDGSPEKISAVYLSPDAFAQRTSEDTIAHQISQVISSGNLDFSHRLPHCEKADDDRIGGWMLMYQLFQSDLWVISDSCYQLINCLPSLVRDEDNREDVLKVDGDDPADSARYGLKSRLSPRGKPAEVRAQERI